MERILSRDFPSDGFVFGFDDEMLSRDFPSDGFVFGFDDETLSRDFASKDFSFDLSREILSKENSMFTLPSKSPATLLCLDFSSAMLSCDFSFGVSLTLAFDLVEATLAWDFFDAALARELSKSKLNELLSLDPFDPFDFCSPDFGSDWFFADICETGLVFCVDSRSIDRVTDLKSFVSSTFSVFSGSSVVSVFVADFFDASDAKDSKSSRIDVTLAFDFASPSFPDFLSGLQAKK